jgi:phosphopantetheinyl transferase
MSISLPHRWSNIHNTDQQSPHPATFVAGTVEIANNYFSAQQAMNLSPLPEFLSLEIKKSVAQPRLQTAMLDLDHLATLIHNGAEKTLCQEWLHRIEEEKLQTLHYEKRHLEWLGGRICAKDASLQYLHTNQSEAAAIRAPQLQIIRSASGRPFLDPSSLPEGLNMPHISISHSRGYALAVAASTRCGIDIQAESETLVRVKDRFCSRAEEELLENRLKQLRPSARLTLLWAAKEAIKKAGISERMPGFLDLVLTHIQSSPETGGHAHWAFILYSQESHQVTVWLHQGYGIALCVIPSQTCTGVDNA